MKLFDAASWGFPREDVIGDGPEREDVYLRRVKRPDRQYFGSQVDDALLVPR